MLGSSDAEEKQAGSVASRAQKKVDMSTRGAGDLASFPRMRWRKPRLTALKRRERNASSERGYFQHSTFGGRLLRLDQFFDSGNSLSYYRFHIYDFLHKKTAKKADNEGLNIAGHSICPRRISTHIAAISG